MKVTSKAMKRCELVVVSGQIDSANAPDLEEFLLDLIQAGKRNLVLNLKEVTFMSSAGLKAMLSAQVKTRRKVPPGSIVISELNPQLKGTLELVGFHHLFGFFESDTEAVGSF
jgi:anti-sigma B factor antagonist